MGTPAIFTLHSGVTPITKPSDVVAYVIRQTLTQPVNASTIYRNEIVSFRQLEAKYGQDKSELKVMYGRLINKILYRYFPEGNILVEIDISETDADGRYNLEIRATYAGENNTTSLLLTDAKISMTEDNILSINFTGAEL